MTVMCDLWFALLNKRMHLERSVDLDKEREHCWAKGD